MTATEYLAKMKKLRPDLFGGDVQIRVVGSVRSSNPYALPRVIVQFSVLPHLKFEFYEYSWSAMVKAGWVAKYEAYERHCRRVAHSKAILQKEIEEADYKETTSSRRGSFSKPKTNTQRERSMRDSSQP